MLSTFVIGLREGLEAALIVSIIATFLRRNAASLRGMWVGVGAGIGLSVAVGVTLRLVEQSLPQARQEALETVIGLIAVVFVTAMVMWMRTHARHLKRDLEKHAAQALANGTTAALATMAFLAVLREGFETAVFLLAAITNATSAPSALAGAMLGIAVSMMLGWGIYRGGVHLNLQRFFSVTSAFLIVVAAGLVLSAFRTAHEAGWVTVGQARTFDLDWLAPIGSLRAALVTGMLGIPHDPRAVELLAWAAYLIPVALITFLPQRFRPGAALAQRLRIAGAGAAVVLAGLLAIFVPLAGVDVPRHAPATDGGTVRLDMTDGVARLTHAGRTVRLERSGSSDTWQAAGVAGSLPRSLDLTTLLQYTGGRVPVGLNVTTAPGPYQVQWDDRSTLTVSTYRGGLLDADASGDLLMKVTGGGLTSPRVLTVPMSAWRLDPAHTEPLHAAVAEARAVDSDRMLWKRWAPVALLLLALVLASDAYRRRTSGMPEIFPLPDRGPAAQVSPVKGIPSDAGITSHV
jgi:high-affinity iron transporter